MGEQETNENDKSCTCAHTISFITHSQAYNKRNPVYPDSTHLPEERLHSSLNTHNVTLSKRICSIICVY